MTKKLITTILLAMAILFGVGFGSTVAFATENDSTEVATLTSNYKVACFKIEGSYTANTPIEFKDGDAVVGTLKIDKSSANTGFGVKLPTGSTFSFVPNANYKVTKLIYALPTNNNSSVVFNTPDAKYGTKFDDLTDADVELLSQAGINASQKSSFGAELNVNHTATEEDPYKFKISMALEFGTICVVYEKLPITETIYPVVNFSTASLSAGDISVKISNTGYAGKTDGTTINHSSQITIIPAPGYIIKSVTLSSPSEDKALGLAYLTGAEDLQVTKDTLSFNITGFKAGKTYAFGNKSTTYWYVKSITIEYEEHEHTGVYEPGSDETHHFKQCECLWRVDEEEHAFGEGEVILEPTHQVLGKAKYTCTNAECGYEKEEKIAPNLADTEVTIDKEYTYNGEDHFIGYTVYYKGAKVGSSQYKKVSGTTMAKEPGVYTFTIGPNAGSIFEGTKEATFTIKKGSVAKPALDTTKFYFDNTVKTYTVENSEFYTVLDNSNQQTNPGSYKVKIALTNPDCYEWEDGTTDTLEYDFVINKGNYDMGKVVFNDLEVTYDGEEHSIIATNLPDGVTVSYEDNVGTNAGTYNAIAKFTGNLDYYNPIDNKTATLTINKAVVTAPTADSTAFTYNGQAQTYALQENSLYTISDTTFTNVGNHTITVSLVDKTNYKWDNGNSNDLTYSFVIAKATYDMSGVVFADTTVTYNGSEFSIEATNLPTGVTASYENNGKTNAGEYTITAKFTGDADNYNLIENKTATLIINKLNVEKPTADSEVYTYNGEEQTYVLQASDLYNILDNKGTNAGNYTVKVVLKDKTNYQWESGNSNDLEYSFVIGKATYDMSGVVFANKTVTYNGSAFSIDATNLPSGVTASYENNGKTEAGVYTIIATFAGNANYNEIPNKIATLTINKATYDMSEVVFANKTVTYNGTAFSIDATNLPTGVTVAYENNGKTDVGEYTITAIFTGNANYNEIPNKTATLTINKATYDMSGVVFANKTVTYNGTAFSIEATNLPTGVTASYENNGKTNAGEYVVTAIFTGNGNYNEIPNKTATLTINKATYDMSGVVFANKTVTYNGTAFSIEATNLPSGVTASYENNGKTEAGVYTIIAKFTGNENYNAIANKTATLTINKATYDMSGVVFANKTVTYNGNAFSIEATNLPSGVTVAYENNGKTDAGIYTITAIFSGNANYNAIANKTATLTINKATYDMSGVVFANKTVVYNGTAFSIEATNLPSGVEVTYENNGKTDAGIYTVTAKFTGNANYNTIADMTAVLTVKNSSLIYNSNPEENISDDVIVSADDGIDPTKELVVELIEVKKSDDNYVEIINKNQKVGVAYDIKLIKDGVSVQPDGTLKFKVMIPFELRNKNFSIIHIHNDNETSVLEYQVDGEYAVFESDKLSDFVFVYDMGSMLWLVILLCVIVLLEVAFILYLINKQKQIKSVKLTSVYPPFVFGMFIPEWHIVLIIVFAVIIAVLTVFSIIYAMKVLGTKNTVLAIEGNADIINQDSLVNSDCANGTISSDGECSDEDAENIISNRNVQSFSNRLNKSSTEVIKYYNEIKSELLAYKNVKSKMSFKHESFRLGKKILAKLKFRGKTLCLYLALNPKDYKDTKYKIEDASNVFSNNYVPTMYKINRPRRSKYAKELIDELMKKDSVEKID